MAAVGFPMPSWPSLEPLVRGASDEPGRYADGLIDAERQRWLGVRETTRCDQLVALLQAVSSSAAARG